MVGYFIRHRVDLKTALGDKKTRVVRGEERAALQRRHEELEARLLKK